MICQHQWRGGDSRCCHWAVISNLMKNLFCIFFMDWMRIFFINVKQKQPFFSLLGKGTKVLDVLIKHLAFPDPEYCRHPFCRQDINQLYYITDWFPLSEFWIEKWCSVWEDLFTGGWLLRSVKALAWRCFALDEKWVRLWLRQWLCWGQCLPNPMNRIGLRQTRIKWPYILSWICHENNRKACL